MPSSYRKAVTGFSRSRHAPRDEPGVGLITRSVMATGAAGYYERPTCVGGRLMEHCPSDERLSQISTMWTMLLRAHDTPTDAARTARHALLERYGGAVHRYLLGAIRDEEAAIELCQEFAMRFLRGDFHCADPARGRFRDYLKTALVHLVGEYRRGRGGRRGDRPLPANTAAAAALDDPDDEAVFLAGWRAELLDRTWDALAAEHPIDHAALHWRVEEPDLASAGIAERLSEQFGKPFTAAAIRKALQ